MASDGGSDDVIHLETPEGTIKVRKQIALMLGVDIAKPQIIGNYNDTFKIRLAEKRAVDKLIEFYNKLSDEESNDAETLKSETEFMEKLSDAELSALFFAAHYLDSETIYDNLRTVIVKRIENKSVEYIRGFFRIKNDFTEEEEAAVRAEHPWAFEGVDPDDFVL